MNSPKPIVSSKDVKNKHCVYHKKITLNIEFVDLFQPVDPLANPLDYFVLQRNGVPVDDNSKYLSNIQYVDPNDSSKISIDVTVPDCAKYTFYVKAGIYENSNLEQNVKSDDFIWYYKKSYLIIYIILAMILMGMGAMKLKNH